MINVQFLAILLRRLVHRRPGERPGEWSYVCALSGQERQGRADILEVVRTNNPEGWANLTQCGGTEEEIIINAKKVVSKVPYEKIKVKEEIKVEAITHAFNNSIPSTEVKQEQEQELSIKQEEDVKQERLEYDVKEEETDEELMNYKFSCMKCSKMFVKASPCLDHMESVCRVTSDHFPQKFWRKTWRSALKGGAKLQACQVKINKSKNISEEELADQIRKFYVANPTIRKTNVVKHLYKMYGRPNFIKYGYGKFSDFIERHGL